MEIQKIVAANSCINAYSISAHITLTPVARPTARYPRSCHIGFPHQIYPFFLPTASRAAGFSPVGEGDRRCAIESSLPDGR